MRSLNNFRVLMMLCFVPLLLTSCKQEQKAATQMPPPLVEVMTVTKGDHPLTFSFVGEAVASDSVEVMAQVGGVLLQRLYQEGSYVEKGQLLYQIESAPYIADLNNAKGMLAQTEAELINSKLNFDRMARLYASKSVSQAEYDKARAAYDSGKAANESAKAQVMAAQIRLDYTNVNAPISGFSGISNVTEGNLISTNMQFTTVSQANPIDVAFATSDTEYDRLRMLGEKGLLEIDDRYAELTDSFGKKMLGKGDIYVMEKVVNRTTGDIKSRARFSNDELVLLPGQYVRVSVKGYFLKNVVLIPFKTVIQTQMGPMVVVIDDKNVATYRPVKIEDNFEQLYLIESGIEPGERIVLEGANKVRPNQPVIIAAPKQPAK